MWPYHILTQHHLTNSQSNHHHISGLGHNHIHSLMGCRQAGLPQGQDAHVVMVRARSLRSIADDGNWTHPMAQGLVVILP